MHIIKTCRCFDLHFPISDNTTKGCYEVNDLACVENATLEFYNGKMAKMCYEKCPVIFFHFFSFFFIYGIH
jgi:hypothetical protein